jgi:hypothetical protein
MIFSSRGKNWIKKMTVTFEVTVISPHSPPEVDSAYTAFACSAANSAITSSDFIT